MNTVKFYSHDLQFHVNRIIDNFKANPENLLNLMPSKSYPISIGNGVKAYYLDVPNIEESYYYPNLKSRNEDYNRLIQLINELPKPLPDAPLKLKVANCRGKKPLMNDLYKIKTKLDELLIEINSCLGKDALKEASVLLFKVLRDNSE